MHPTEYEGHYKAGTGYGEYEIEQTAFLDQQQRGLWTRRCGGSRHRRSLLLPQLRWEWGIEWAGFPDKARRMFAQSINLHELEAWDPFPRASVALLELQKPTLRGTRGLDSAAATQAAYGQLLRKSRATAKPNSVGNGVKEAFLAPYPRRNPPKSRRWNPSQGLGGDPWYPRFYCIFLTIWGHF